MPKQRIASATVASTWKSRRNVVAAIRGWLAWAWGILVLGLGVAAAQDRVTVLLSDNLKTHERTGTVIDWKGTELQMETGGRITSIKNDRIVGVETTWPGDFQLARELLAKRQFEAALVPLQNALAEEDREWVKRIIMAELVRVAAFAGQPRKACETFLLLLESDPETREFAMIPLAWDNSTTDAPTIELAEKMLAAKSLTIQLLGASWLVASPQRNAAIGKLESLSRDIDEKIAHLASAQLWRVGLIELDAAQLGRWERQIDRMPRELRTGPLLILGQGQMRMNRLDAAVLSWLRVPILHAENYQATASALQQAALSLQNNERTDEAERLWSELAHKFPESAWGREAQMALTQLRQPKNQQKGP